MLSYTYNIRCPKTGKTDEVTFGVREITDTTPLIKEHLRSLLMDEGYNFQFPLEVRCGLISTTVSNWAELR